MYSKTNLLFFIVFSAILHFLLIFYFNPKTFLFTNIQNIKLKKNITKIKFVKIVEKPKKKPKPKPKPKPKTIPKPVPNQKITTKPKINPKVAHSTPKKNLSKKQPTKKATKNLKNKKKKIKKEPTLDFSIIKKKIEIIKKREKKREEILKKREKEKLLKEKLKQEAAIFYSNKIVSLIQSLWVLPKVIKDSELLNLEIKVKLKVDKKGNIIGKPIILDKSNNEIFNESALRAIEKLNNYKIPLPDIIDEDYLDIVITLKPPNL